MMNCACQTCGMIECHCQGSLADWRSRALAAEANRDALVEALKRARKYVHGPDLVVVDAILARIDGWESQAILAKIKGGLEKS